MFALPGRLQDVDVLMVLYMTASVHSSLAAIVTSNSSAACCMCQNVRLPETHCPLVAGLQHRVRQEPSFARSTPSFGNRGVQGGDFIVRGADGRGGRATILKPYNRPTAAAQVLCIALHGHGNAFHVTFEQSTAG